MPRGCLFSVSLLIVLAAAIHATAAASLPDDLVEAGVELVYPQPIGYPLQGEIDFEEVTAGSTGVVIGGETGGPAGTESRLIYSNTLGIYGINFPANQPVSDDISTTARDGCNLRMFKFKVLGKVLPTGASGPFTVTYSLYSTCPLSVGPTSATAHLRELVKIPGTSGEITFPDDTPRTIKHVVEAHQSVTIPSNLYLGIQFNRSNCGTVLGAPAMVGYSGDIWDFPGFPCNGYLGGFPQLPHASFWLEMYGDASCAPAFPGYKLSRPSGGIAPLGADVQGVDDIHLQVEECRMTGYEVVVKGVGFYTFDLRRQCDGQIIDGTERTFQVTSATSPQVQVARFTFNPPIFLPDDDLFFGFRSTSSSSGTVLASVRPIIGNTGQDYFTIEQGNCLPVNLPVGSYGSVNVSITCEGELPTGACCDMALTECSGGGTAGWRCSNFCTTGIRSGLYCTSDADCAGGLCGTMCDLPGTCDSLCRQTPRMNCPVLTSYPQVVESQWVGGASCDSDPFTPSCGLGACCLPNDTCENLTNRECALRSIPGDAMIWQRGQTCSEGDQWCPFYGCLNRSPVACYLPHEGQGCSDSNCCQEVCTLDSWCCQVEWDRPCAEYAGALCRTIPFNDRCDPGANAQLGPIELVNSVPYFGNNVAATESTGDPVSCCSPYYPNFVDEGTVWFKFIATHESAAIDTCASDPDGDTLVSAFAIGDPTNSATRCASLSLIGCGDNGGCQTVDNLSPGTNHSRFCLDGLQPGTMYYIMLASKTEPQKGSYQIEVKMPCQSLTPFSSDDCNNNGKLDGCDLGARTSRDCDHNLIPDECQDEDPAVADCDGDRVGDTCDPFRYRLSPDDVSSEFGKSFLAEEEFILASDPALGKIYQYQSYPTEYVLNTAYPDPLLQFGKSLDYSSNWLLTTSSGDPNPGDRVVGAVQAFERVRHVSTIYLFQPRAFPPIPEEPQGTGLALSVSIHGDLAAVSMRCLLAPAICDHDVVVHLFRRRGTQWTYESRVPMAGSFRSRGFAMELYGDTLAVVTDGMYDTGANIARDGDYGSYDFLYLYQPISGIWQRSERFDFWEASLVDGQRIAFEDNLLAIPINGLPDVSLLVFRKEIGGWSEDNEAFDVEGPAGMLIRDVDIIPPALIALTSVHDQTKCARVVIFRWGANYGPWKATATLETSHCGEEDWMVTVDSASDYVAVGVTPTNDSAVPGSIYVFAIPPTDCDESGTPDLCDVQAGLLDDCNNDGAADVCQRRDDFDGDLDYAVTLRDIALLQNCFSGNTYVAPCCDAFDEFSPFGIDTLDWRYFAASMTGP